jgi:acetyl esterase/lipase
MFFLILSISLFSACHSQKRNFNANDFKEWFTKPTTALTTELSSIPLRAIDSFVKVIRMESVRGSLVDTLTDTTGTAYTLGLRTPKEIKPDTLYPLVIYLHGGTGTHINTKGEKAYEMLLPLADSMQLFLASPSANRDARWWDATGLYRILQTVRYMTLHYPIAPDRIFLAGVSDGAAGCWAAANCINGPFAGFFAISGFGGILPSTGMELYPENIKQRPIYSVNAGNDRLYSIDMVNEFLDYMMSKGVPVTRKNYPDQEHGFDYRDKEFSTLCGFLKTWKRAENNPLAWTFSPGFPNRPQSVVDWTISEVTNHRFVESILSDDTLAITMQGISSVTLDIPFTPEFIYVKTGKSSPRKIISNKTNYLRLQSMIMQSYPANQVNHCFKITF